MLFKQIGPRRLRWMNQAKRAVNTIGVGDEGTYYHVRHNFSFPASQLACRPAYQPACLIACPHTEHLLSRLKGHGWGTGEILFLFTRIHFEKGLNVFTLCASSPDCPPPLLTIQPFAIALLWLAVFLSNYCTCWFRIARSISNLFSELCERYRNF